MKSFKQFLYENIITERLSAVLFHSTSIHNLYKIASNNEFRLTPDFGTESEYDRRSKRRFYYMSFSRSAINDYHYSKGGGNCIIKIDGDSMNRRGFVGKPIDYWGGDHNDEMEDRLYHNKRNIKNATDYIIEVHSMPNLRSEDRKKKDIQLLRKCYILLKKQGVELFVYDDPNNYKLLNKRKAVNISDMEYDKDLDIGKPYSSVNYRKPFGDYLELLSDVPNERLSEKAIALLRKIKYDNFGDVKRTLSADIHNNRQGKYRDDLDRFLDKVKSLKLDNVQSIIDYIEQERI